MYILTKPNREFYGNAKIRVGNIELEVKGVRIILNVARLGHTLRMPIHGHTYDHLEESIIGLQFILGRDKVSKIKEILTS